MLILATVQCVSKVLRRIEKVMEYLNLCEDGVIDCLLLFFFYMKHKHGAALGAVVSTFVRWNDLNELYVVTWLVLS